MTMGNPIVHFELIGTDAARLKSFYSELFGWKIGDLMPDMGNYGLIDPESAGIGGGVGQSDDGTGRVTVYAQVPDLRATLDQAVALGGKVLMEPTDIPGVSLALFADPEGNVMGLTKG
jgi:predicted enzyme related to lactoylglutathione lyase